MSWLLLAFAMQIQSPEGLHQVKVPPASASEAPAVKVWTIPFKRGDGVPIDILKHLPREAQLRLLKLSKQGAAIEIYIAIPPS